MEKLKFGWAEVDITPKKGTKIGLAGQFFERITDKVESPITLTALALDSGDDYCIFCSCDLGGASWNLLMGVREKLKEKNIIANMTVNQIHFERKQDFIKELINNKLIYGLGVSLKEPTEEFINFISGFSFLIFKATSSKSFINKA